MSKRELQYPRLRGVRAGQGVTVCKTISAVVLLAGLLALTGCSPVEKSRTTYWYPNWTPDGKIVSSKEVEYYKSGAPFSGDTTTKVEDSVVEMSSDGSNERTICNGVFGWILQVSPSKNYLAASIAGSMWVVDYNTGQKLTWKNFGGDIFSFDWSPDETKLAISGPNVSDNIEIYDRNLNLVKTLIPGGELAWKFNSRIAFHGNEGITLYDITNDTVATTNISVNPDTYDITGRYLYDIGGGAYRFDTQSMTGTQQSIYSNDLTRKHFSPIGDKACGSLQADGGICVLNIDGTGKVKIR